MIVGGYAVAFHGFPRFTKDLDIFFDPAAENVSRLCEGEESVPREALATPGKVLVIGVPPIRVDLLNRIDGITFREAIVNAVRRKYGGLAATFIGLQELIRNKLSTSRAKDKADVEELT